MKRMIVPAAVLVLAAGCTDGGGGSPAGDATTAAEPDAPYELELSVPDGFTEIEDGERDFHLAEDYRDWIFQLEGDDVGQIAVSSYLVPEGTDTADRDAQIALIRPHDKDLGNTADADNFGVALVHRVEGLHRYYYAEPTGGGFVEAHYFYLFSGRNVIQISCQWGPGGRGNAVQQACMNLSQDFVFPDGWEA